MTRKPKLTDLDLVLLSGAAQRTDGMLLPPPESVRARGKTLEKTLAKILRLRLVEECPATAADQIWRRDETDRGIALRIAAAGRDVLGLGSKPEPGVGLPADPEPGPSEPSDDDRGSVAGDVAQAPGIKPGTKQARLVECLSRPWGASIDDLVQALGWQPHTVRAALTGLRKKGYDVTRAKDDRGVTVYRATRSSHAAKDAA